MPHSGLMFSQIKKVYCLCLNTVKLLLNKKITFKLIKNQIFSYMLSA